MNLNFGWVIEGKLAGSRGPRSREDLVSLRDRGIGALVRLIEPYESSVTSVDVNKAGLEDYNEPVQDFTAPAQTQIDRIIAYIDSHLERGIPVGVSCNAGIGRTGVILACYLVHKGFAAKDALELLREKRGRTPEIPEQIEAIKDYWLRSRSNPRRELGAGT
jgi:atypical dual specificity phosphatase